MALPQLGELGAGLQITPNATRLLHRWGLASQLAECATRPAGLAFHHYATGERVGYSRWDADEFGAPFYSFHRADLHQILFNLVRARAEIRLGAAVASVNPEEPLVTLSSGETVGGDVIIGADGIKSKVQEAVTGRAARVLSTGFAAYRAIVPAQALLEDSDLKFFMESPQVTLWMVPGRHVVGYPIASPSLTFEQSSSLSFLRSAPTRSTTLS